MASNLMRVCWSSLRRNGAFLATDVAQCQRVNSGRCISSCIVLLHSNGFPEKPKKLTNEEWAKRLTKDQYYVCREEGTEPPFSGQYYNHKENGVYICICCGCELFSSRNKYDSGSGWPSFSKAYVKGGETESNVLTRKDMSLGMVRKEVICKKCNSHLGHVFNDGPAPQGERYCINSLALKFTPKKLKS